MNRTALRRLTANSRSLSAGRTNVQVHVLDDGHFALDTAADEIATLVRDFVAATISEFPVSMRDGCRTALLR